MPRLSIVIPSTEGTEHFEATLVSVLQNRPADCEVLVVQPHAYDDPYGLAGEVRFVEAPGDSNEVDLLNIGIQCASSPVVHLLGCEVEVTEGWAEHALDALANPSVGSVAPLIVSCQNPARRLAAGIGYKIGGSWYRVEPTSTNRTVQGPAVIAGFYRRSAVLDVGGLCRRLGLEHAGVDLALNLTAVGWEAAHVESSVVMVQQWPRPLVLSYRRGEQAERLFWRHASQAGWFRSLAAHAAMVMGRFLSQLYRPASWLELCGRLAGCTECFRIARHERKLDEAYDSRLRTLQPAQTEAESCATRRRAA